jgi:hypothetical protein
MEMRAEGTTIVNHPAAVASNGPVIFPCRQKEMGLVGVFLRYRRPLLATEYYPRLLATTAGARPDPGKIAIVSSRQAIG